MHVGPMIIILLYYYIGLICGCSVWVRVCVHLRTHVYACGRMNVRVCVRTLVRAYMCVRECARAHVGACGCAHVRARVMLRMCLCMHVRLKVRAGVHTGMRACAYINRMYAY